jgi:small-conductance mechanosensitive channel
VPFRGFFHGLLLLVLALGFATLAQLLTRAQDDLADAGVLPSLVRGLGTLTRVLAAFVGLGVVAAWVPASVAPALPWILVGGAAAIGWSARDVLPDLVAWLFLTMEGQVKAGLWLRGPDFSGEVLRVGLRGSVLRDVEGRELSVPNRRLLLQSVRHDKSPWPLVEVAVSVPGVYSEAQTRAALRDAALLSPWVAPLSGLQVLGDPAGSEVWRVRVRLLEGQFLGAFEGSLRARVLEQFGSKVLDLP